MTRKKQLSIIITCVFIVCLACVFTTKVNAEGHITRDEWIHKLVTELNLSIDNEIYPDDYYPDIVESEYYDDILIAIKNGLIDLEPGENFEPDKIVTREYTAHMVCSYIGRQLNENDSYTMNDMESLTYPEDDQIAIDSGWFELVNDEFKPEKEIETSEITSIINDIKSSYIMMDIDSNHENSYEYAEGVVEVPDGTEIVISENKIDIVDCPVNIVDDDVFVVYQYGIPCAFKAVDVTVEDDVTSVITEDYDMDGVLINADAEGIIYVEPSMLTPAEDDMTISVIEDNTVNNSKRLAKKVKSTKPLKPYKFKINAGSIGLSGEVSNLCLEYKFIGKDLYIGLKGYLKINASQTVGSKTSVPFFVCEPIVGVQMQVSVDYSINGTAALNYATSFRVGAGYKVLKGKWEAVHTFENDDFTFEAKINAKVGLTARIVAGDGVIFNGSLYASTGLKAELSSVRHLDGSLPKTCTGLEAYAYAEAGYNLKVNILGAPSYNDKISFFDENNPPLYIYYHYEDGQFVDHCTRGITTSSGKKRKYITKPYGGGSKKTISSYIDSGYVTTTDSGTGEVTYKPAYDYTLDDEGNATITKYNGYARYLDIPEYIDGHKVIAIGNRTFEGNTYISVVHIPDDVNEIGYRSFAECTNLYEINLPKGLVRLSEQVFYDDDKIASITIPKSLDECSGNTWTNDVESGFSGPFDHCDGLKDVKFENGITEISCCLFGGCPGIEEITIPDTVTKIENNGFYQCSNLKKVGMSDTVTEMGYSAFAECPELSEIDLPKGLVKLSEQVFYDDDKIASITIPKSLDECSGNTWTNDVESGFSGPFDHCDGLKDVKFENGVTEISCCLFGGCPGIEEITIPDTVTKIENNGFYQCSNLKKVGMSDTVTEMGYSAFAECPELSEIDLPKGLVKLSEQVFYDDDKITSITVPKALDECAGNTWTSSVDSGFSGPFDHCDGLKDVKFENGVTEISCCLFGGCTGIETIRIPKTVKTIEQYAFMGSGIKTINFNDVIDTIEYSAFADCNSLKEISIPDNVKYIGACVFERCSSLERVKIPNITINILERMFYECDSLVEINLPNTLQTIGDHAFYKCSSLTEIEIPDKVITVCGNAFSDCTSLTKVVIPQSVEEIWQSAFSHCESLTDLTISEGVTAIYSNAFEYNKSLAKVTLPDSLQTLGDYAFQYCDVLSDVQLGAGLKTVPKYCFYEDPELVSVVLPQQMTTVDEFAFGNCTKFTDVTMNRNVTSAAVNAFSYPAKLTIHGVSGTYAEDFASENNIKFAALNTNTTAIKLNKTSLELGRGYSALLTASITPTDSAEQLTWTSSDEDIVTVDENGKVKGISGGETSIIAMSGDVMEICNVKVYEAVSSVSVSPYSYEGTTGNTVQLEASIYPSNATYQDVTWSSDNDDIATVDSNGLVTLGKYGTAKITVTSKDMNRTATCTITVKDIAVTGVSLNAKNVTIAIGEEKELSATIQPENASNKNVTWTSSKPDVVSVNAGKITAIKEGTANIIVKTESGAKTASCTVTVVAEHVHNLIHTDAKESTCKEAGNIEYWTCEGCDKIFVDAEGDEEITVEDTIIPKKEHTPSEAVKENEEAATCEEDGSYDEVVKCSVCDEVISSEHKVVPALEHDWGEWTETKPATDTSTGEETRICKRDPNHKETREIEKSVHVHNLIHTEAKAATCKEAGNIEYWTCEGCDKIFEDEDGKNEITVADTLIPKKEHTPSEVVRENEVAATCENAGSYDEVIKCTACGDVISRDHKVVPALGHDWGEWSVTKAATETSVGEEFRICKHDPSHKETREIAKLQHTHNPSAAIKENVVEATYDKGGSYDEVIKCTVCGEVLSRKTITTNALQSQTKPVDTTKPVDNTTPATQDNNKNVVAKEEGTPLSVPEEKAEVVVTSKAGETPTVEYKSTNNSTMKNVSIPSEVNVEGVTYQVTEIADNAFMDNKNIESVVISANVEIIGENAFSNCTKLKNVVISNSVEVIEKNAFSGCKSLEKVELTDNIKEVGDGTFLKCVKLKKVILGKNTTKVGKNAFKGCKSLKTIVVKSTKLTNKSFGKNAFNGINKKATFKCPKKQFKNYKKWIKKAGAPKTAKYKK